MGRRSVYAFPIGRFTKERSGKQTITYTCRRSCQLPDISGGPQRKTTTRGTGCKSSVLAKESLDKCTWCSRHRLDKQFSLLNRMPSNHPSGHLVHRRLDTDVGLSNAAIATKDIRTYIQQNPLSAAIQQDIYNQNLQSRNATPL
jgi:hypothetical protein